MDLFAPPVSHAGQHEYAFVAVRASTPTASAPPPKDDHGLRTFWRECVAWGVLTFTADEALLPSAPGKATKAKSAPQSAVATPTSTDDMPAEERGTRLQRVFVAQNKDPSPITCVPLHQHGAVAGWVGRFI
jgi:hypothetical protein